LEWSAGIDWGGGDSECSEKYAIVPAAVHPDSNYLLSFWEARPRDGIVLGRDVPSRAIARLLGSIMVWEPVEQGQDMKVRLAGDALHRRFPGDLRGRRMSELFMPVNFRGHLQNAHHVIAGGQPLILDSRMYYGNIEKLHVEVVLLPVAAHDRSGNWLMAGSFYFN
jgi:hypothetical protein